MSDYTCQHCVGTGEVESDLSPAERAAWGNTLVCPECGGTGLDAPPEWEEQHGLENPTDWARVPSIAELYKEERYEEPDEDLRPTDVVLSSDPGWITP